MFFYKSEGAAAAAPLLFYGHLHQSRCFVHMFFMSYRFR